MADELYRDGLQEDNGGFDFVDGAQHFPVIMDEDLYGARCNEGSSAGGCSYEIGGHSCDFINDSGLGGCERLNSTDSECEQRGGASQGGRGHVSAASQSASATHAIDACAQTMNNMRLNSTDSCYRSRDSAYGSSSLNSFSENSENNTNNNRFVNETQQSAAIVGGVANPRWLPETYIDEDGDSQLHLAVTQRREDVVSEILGHCDLPPGYVNYRDAHGRTALHLAVLTNQPELFKVLLESSADPSAPDLNGDTPLHMACRDSFVSCVKTLVTLISFLYPASQFDPNSRNYQGFTCLHLAAANGDRDVTAFLVNHFHVNINAGDGCSGRTVLHHAADRGDRNFVYFLLNDFRDRLNVDAVAHDQRTTPLALARGRHHKDIVEVLMEGGAKRNLEQDFYSESESDSETEMCYCGVCY